MRYRKNIYLQFFLCKQNHIQEIFSIELGPNKLGNVIVRLEWFFEEKDDCECRFTIFLVRDIWTQAGLCWMSEVWTMTQIGYFAQLQFDSVCQADPLRTVKIWLNLCALKIITGIPGNAWNIFLAQQPWVTVVFTNLGKTVIKLLIWGLCKQMFGELYFLMRQLFALNQQS